MYLQAAAFGARRGPYWIASLLAAGRRGRVVVFLTVAAVFSVLMLIVWGFWVVVGVPLMSLVFGLAGWSGLAVVADGVARLRWYPSDHSGPVLATAPSGKPATAWLRSKGALVRPWALVVMTAVLAMGEVVAASLGGFGWGFVAPALLIVFGAWFAPPLVLGKARAGGLYLTSDGIEHLYGTDLATVAWDDVVVWHRLGSLGLIDQGGIQRDRGGWRVWDVPDRMVRSEDVPIPVAFLTGRGPVIAESIEGIRADPDGSPTPGTIGSVGVLRELAALRRVTFDASSD